MLKKIALIREQLEQANFTTGEQLENFRLKFLSKKGDIAQLFDTFSQLPAPEKRNVGAALNELKKQAQACYERAQEKFTTTFLPNNQLEEDYTLPSPENTLGTLHPISLLKLEILSFFSKIGFGMVEGPEIEDDWHNFEALNFSPNHPARDMVDTFFIAHNPDRLLRTHTTSVQVRMLEKHILPLRIVSVGRVYRNETISARSHCMFHQLDGVYVDEEVTFADLKQVLSHFMRHLFGTTTTVRLRPSYFPFTILSAEIDVDCKICQRKGCNLCKNTGWLEIMGAGMIHPQVLRNCQIDPSLYSGYAFGMGLERVAMLYYNINDIRLFTENDTQFLKQFKLFP